MYILKIYLPPWHKQQENKDAKHICDNTDSRPTYCFKRWYPPRISVHP